MKLSKTTESLFLDFLSSLYGDLNDKERMVEIEMLINTAPDAQLFLEKLKKEADKMEVD